MAVLKRKVTFKKAGASSSSAEFSLPDAPKEPSGDFMAYCTCVYARAGFGKSTFMASFPDAIFFSTERVSKGLRCYDFNAEQGGVHSWDVFRAGVRLLEKERGRFGTVCIDTIDAAYGQALDWVCAKHGIEYPQDKAYGKGWNAVKTEFVEQLDRLWATGRGIVFSSHSKEAEITSASGIKYTRIQPTMGGQAWAFIKAKSDYLFYGEFFKDRRGQLRRVWITTGDELVEAKHAPGHPLPRFLPCAAVNGVSVVQRAFAGEDVGIDPADIIPDKQTSLGGVDLARRQTRKEGKPALFKRKG